MRRTYVAAMGMAICIAALGSGCRKGQAAVERSAATDRGAGTPSAAPARGAPTANGAAFPDTTGEALWTYVTAAPYESWRLWPGKGRFFPGESPHGALLTVYVDSLVYDALTNGAMEMPARSVIVKENYGPDSTLKAHTVMYKVPGYSREHHDWFWGQYAPDGKVLAAGRVQLCWGCHDVAAKYDDLWILRDQKYLEGR